MRITLLSGAAVVIVALTGCGRQNGEPPREPGSAPERTSDGPTAIARNIATVDLLVSGLTDSILSGTVISIGDNRGAPVAEGQSLDLSGRIPGSGSTGGAIQPGDSIRCKISFDGTTGWRLVSIITQD